MTKNVLILAGGGGHTGFGFALAQRLQGKANLSFIVPKNDHLSYNRLSKFGPTKFLLKARGPKTPNNEFIGNLMRAFIELPGKVNRNLDVVVSTGSNFCIPPALQASLMGIGLVSIEGCERFTKASRTAKVLEPLSKITALQWNEQKKLLPRGTVFGPIIPYPEIKPWNGGYILVTGGTFGFKQLFDVVSECNLDQVVMQTGPIDPKPYLAIHPNWRIFSYSNNFQELLAGASILITHFGSTAQEALVYGKPTIMVVNPEWTRTVGSKDAEMFAAKIGATLINELNPKMILDSINNIQKSSLPLLPDGAKKLGEAILNL